MVVCTLSSQPAEKASTKKYICKIHVFAINSKHIERTQAKFSPQTLKANNKYYLHSALQKGRNLYISNKEGQVLRVERISFLCEKSQTYLIY